MRRTIFTAFMAFVFLAASAQEASEYIVKTRGAKKKALTEQFAEGDAAGAAAEEEESAKDFISANFKFYSLCDWQEGMRFMVLPEKYDLVVKTFTDASTGKEVSSMPLKYKIMVYQGHDEGADGHARVHFNCPENGRSYYYEIPNGTFDDYCYAKTGVPTLAYLGDVDIAREKLMGKTMYTKTQHFRVDTDYDSDGFQEVIVDKNKEVKVVAVGVGTRSFPVKIIVEDQDGNEFFQNVAISKTNSGMRDEEFIMDNTKFLFGGSFELVDDIMAVNAYNYKTIIGRTVHTKIKTTMLNETTKQQQGIPRLAEYTVEEFTPHKADHLYTVKLKNTTLGTYFYKDIAFDGKHGDDESNQFGYIFAPGPGKEIQTTEESRKLIRAGQINPGFSEDEVMLAVGEPTSVVNGPQGIHTWTYNQGGGKQLIVDFDGTNTVTDVKVKTPAAKKTTNARRRTTSSSGARRSSSQSWQSRKGTPL
ncbi:MAG: hypothetical protein J1E58_04415 [Prevotella sp.]|nr:hypothetical protein [Prevotella sp.]